MAATRMYCLPMSKQPIRSHGNRRRRRRRHHRRRRRRPSHVE
jgi:hypothetical protein